MSHKLAVVLYASFCGIHIDQSQHSIGFNQTQNRRGNDGKYRKTNKFSRLFSGICHNRKFKNINYFHARLSKKLLILLLIILFRKADIGNFTIKRVNFLEAGII
jgi:hypothetical protein